MRRNLTWKAPPQRSQTLLRSETRPAGTSDRRNGRRERDINIGEILATRGDPLDEFLGLLHGQKRIDEDSIAFARNERDGVRNPSDLFLASCVTALPTDLPIPGVSTALPDP